jgi:hypothetical protein
MAEGQAGSPDASVGALGGAIPAFAGMTGKSQAPPDLTRCDGWLVRVKHPFYMNKFAMAWSSSRKYIALQQMSW